MRRWDDPETRAWLETHPGSDRPRHGGVYMRAYPRELSAKLPMATRAGLFAV